jgi:AraC-like DNA-binding protein
MRNEIAHFFRETPERTLISCLDIKPLVCGYVVGKTDLQEFHPFRTDPFFRMYYPIEGKLQVSGCAGATIIQPGNLYLFPANVPFRFLYQGEFTHKWVHFYSDAMKRLPCFRKVLSIPFYPEYAVLWDELLNTASLEDSRSETFLRAVYLIQQILVPFIENMDAEHSFDFAEQLRLQPAVDYASSHFHEEVTTEQMAQQCNMRKNDFSKAFHKAYGVAPKQYLINLRLEHAKELLLTTNYSIKIIADQCGYENDYFFYRIFKKHVNKTPQEFRSWCRLG